tara:strand:- start:631 stop:816 length:186 start_codon:yes stop_codon:yes gene_type:complete
MRRRYSPAGSQVSEQLFAWNSPASTFEAHPEQLFVVLQVSHSSEQVPQMTQQERQKKVKKK